MANEEITLTFREAMNELSAIVEALESNTLQLEESLVKYERGVTLLRYLKSSLADAQQKVEVLMGETDTNMTIRKPTQNFPRLSPRLIRVRYSVRVACAAVHPVTDKAIAR